MARIGIMGGTFNPIHNGHLYIARNAYQQFHLDTIYFMPNHIPAYKDTKAIVSGKDRLAMVNLALEGEPSFQASDFELQRTGTTYTYETLQLLHKQQPSSELYFIMGADSLFAFDEWRHPEIITAHATLLVAVRNQISDERLQQQIERLNTRYGKHCFQQIKSTDYPISSSDIRKGLATKVYEKGQSTMLLENLAYLTKTAQELHLTPEVLQYILQHGFYQ